MEINLEKNKSFNLETTSFSLHIMAMIFMLCDHLWGTIVSGNDWLTCIGRLAFPIYSFMIVEGYFHTKNLKKYVSRLFLFALISEIPFNLAIGSNFFSPIYQNVLWSFLISIGLIHWNEKMKTKVIWKRIIVAILSILVGYIVGIITFIDYHYAGIFMTLVFYFFRDKKWWNYLLQLICLWYINFEMLGGFSYELTILGQTHFVARQGLAILSLIPIWLYRGKQGYHSKVLKYVYYAFYPIHLLILGIIKLI